MTDQEKTLWAIGLAAVAAIVILGVLVTAPQQGNAPVVDTPYQQSQTTDSQVQSNEMSATDGSSVSTIEPAATASSPAATESATGTGVTTTTEPATPTTPVTTSYSTEEECKQSTNTACHYVTCDAVPEGKTAAEVCGADFKTGWQALAPTPDQTAVPEVVAPPMTPSEQTTSP